MSNKRYDHTSFAHNLRATREMRELTQEQLADMTGLQPAAVSHFETGQRQPNLRNLVRLVIALNTSPNNLLTP